MATIEQKLTIAQQAVVVAERQLKDATEILKEVQADVAKLTQEKDKSA